MIGNVEQSDNCINAVRNFEKCQFTAFSAGYNEEFMMIMLIIDVVVFFDNGDDDFQFMRMMMEIVVLVGKQRC